MGGALNLLLMSLLPFHFAIYVVGPASHSGEEEEEENDLLSRLRSSAFDRFCVPIFPFFQGTIVLGTSSIGTRIQGDTRSEGQDISMQLGKSYCGAKRLIFSGSRKNSSPVFLAQASYLMGVPKKFF